LTKVNVEMYKYPMSKEINWSLPLNERANLLAALHHNCDCSFETGVRTSLCEPHRMLITKRDMDHLQFGKTLERQMREEEFRT
jgi:hypothetical protein